ncbi:hypothetical protein [Salinibaculum rarum]|uniref:hypothetical protein n=1 Tax=Salinibaculum rarum TaxID=3058903 RepID=UPI00265E9A6B|nr:hypothetical protein [Salinibaculum sp. KK48]
MAATAPQQQASLSKTLAYKSIRPALTTCDTWELLFLPGEPVESGTEEKKDDADFPEIATSQTKTNYGITTTTHTVSAARLPLVALAVDAFAKTRCTPPVDLPVPTQNQTYQIRAARCPDGIETTDDQLGAYKTLLEPGAATEWSWIADAIGVLTEARNTEPRLSRETATETPAHSSSDPGTHSGGDSQETSTEAVFDAGVLDWVTGVRLRNRIQILVEGNDCTDLTVYDLADAGHASVEAVSSVFAPAAAAIRLGAPITIPGFIDADAHADSAVGTVSMFTTVDEFADTIHNAYDPGEFGALTLQYYYTLAENPNTELETLLPDTSS